MASEKLDFEAEYNNRARVPEHPVHIAGWQRDAAAYRESSHCELNLVYGPGERHRLDLFSPENGDNDGPVVLSLVVTLGCVLSLSSESCSSVVPYCCCARFL